MEFGKVPRVTLIALFFFHFKLFEIIIELICDSFLHHKSSPSEASGTKKGKKYIKYYIKLLL